MSLVVEQALGLVTVQDLGRPGRMHEGLAPGGALVPEVVVFANKACGNAEHAAVIEVLGKLVVRAERDVAVVITTSKTERDRLSGATRAIELVAGDEVVLDSEPFRVAYLAIAGGVDAPVVLGSRATQLSAGIGARLRAGDRIASHPASPVFDLSSFHTSGWSTPSDTLPLRVIPGPDLDAFAPGALEAACAGTYRIEPTSDRVGTRLRGAALPRAAGYVDRSRPGVRGAIEVPPDGQPIVLGPEHPTTIGYAVIGVIASHDLDRFHLTRVGGEVRFFVPR